MLGLYISDHPLLGLEARWPVDRLHLGRPAGHRPRRRRVWGAVGYGGDGQIRTVGGVVTELSRRYTKKGDLMATSCSRTSRSIEAFVFPKAMTDYGALLDDDAIVVVRGRPTCGTTASNWCAWRCSGPTWPWTDPPTCGSPCPSTPHRQDRRRLKRLLAEHPGTPPSSPRREKVLRLPSEFKCGQPSGTGRRTAGAAPPHAILA